ncbi:hypothetical protein B0H34DRAFT_100888 [Crassisporium funariophilum]|nr:hypothetical protein B0H34DRAFT_100888 [Crassisporium funariophilum]
MDTSGFSQVGRYGTISLLKRNETNTVIASFGIDTEELTFGRETTCGVRLYYPDVALIHCKIVFEERKAFMVVLGDSGVLVDGCKVFPHTSNNATTIIPLTNHSEFEIHNKRFKFSYPPKNVRATLFATPARPQKRALRLSMIHSAQVFSPRPSKDPRENLRILQSPLKNTFRSPAKPSSLSRLQQHEEEQDEIVLVQGSHPQVVEEGRDLVILEDVPIAQSTAGISSTTQSQEMLPPSTPPRRRSLGGNALHRAVLIRSAQRAVLKAEREREDEEEEMEVLDTVVGEGEEEEVYEEGEGSDVEMLSASDEQEEREEYDDEDVDNTQQPPKPMWRKSLEKIMWPFGRNPVDEEENAGDAQQDDADNHSDEDHGEIENLPPSTQQSMEENLDRQPSDEDDEFDDYENEGPAPLPSRPSGQQQTPIRRNLGSFVTPQARGQPTRTGLFPPSSIAANSSAATAAGGRYSLGGGEARRVVVQQPWRVRDLVVPSASTANTTADTIPNGSVSGPDGPTAASLRVRAVEPQQTPMRTPARPALSEEERKAIQERRRSALKEVDTFFVGGVPGLSPVKSRPSTSSSMEGSGSSSRMSTSPVKPGMRSTFVSPMKVRAIPEEEEVMDYNSGNQETATVDDTNEELDTRSLLERMKETVDGMKRRRSVALGYNISETPGKTHTAPLNTPRLSGPTNVPKHSLFQHITGSQDKEQEVGKEMLGNAEEPFSLLRPGAHEGTFASSRNNTLPEDRSPEHRVVPLPIVVVDEAEDMAVDHTPEEKEEPKKPRGRARLLRASKAVDAIAGSDAEQDEDEMTLKTRSKTSTTGTTRRARSKTPQTQTEMVEDKLPVPTKSTTTRRTRKPATDELVPEIVPAAANATGRRGRKAAADPEPESREPEPEKPKKKAASAQKGRKLAVAEQVSPEEQQDEVSEPTPAPVKKGRPRKVVPATTVGDSSNQEEPALAAVAKPAPKMKATTASRVRGTRTKAVADEDVDDEDPLDSYNAVEDDDADLPAPPPPKAAPKARGRKKATPAVVKHEDDEGSSNLEDAPLATTKVARASKTNSVAASKIAIPVVTKTPAQKPGAKKAKTKTPATAPAAVTAGRDTNKENTPGSLDSEAGGSGKQSPHGSGDSEDAQEGVAVKVRVSRTRGAVQTNTGKASSALKGKTVKAEIPEEGPMKTRAIRTTRTRTKTG